MLLQIWHSYKRKYTLAWCSVSSRAPCAGLLRCQVLESAIIWDVVKLLKYRAGLYKPPGICFADMHIWPD